MSAGIILDGQRFACDAPVLTWLETGLEFKAGRGARRRTKEIDLFVVHWTGGENEPPAMFRTLERRELGIEFAITREETTPGYSTIYQFCDPIAVDTFDAGYVNRRSMGVEIVNYGWRNPRKLWLIPKRGKERDRYKTSWGKRNPTYARFYPHQLHTLLALANTVIDSGVTRIERQVPRIVGQADMIRRTMTRPEVAEFRGVLGHNHISAKKADPGTDALEMLIANGY